MSTHANIILKEKNGNIFLIHVWYDGYEEALGKVLESRSIENLEELISPENLILKNQSIKNIFINEAKNVNLEIMDRPGTSKYSMVEEIPSDLLLDGSDYQYMVGLNHKEKQHVINKLLNNNLLYGKPIVYDKFFQIDYKKDFCKNEIFNEELCEKIVSKFAKDLDYSYVKKFKNNIDTWQVNYSDFLKKNYLTFPCDMSKEEEITFQNICNNVIKSEFGNRQKEKSNWLFDGVIQLHTIEVFDGCANDDFVKAINDGIEEGVNNSLGENLNYIKNRIGLFEKEEFMEIINNKKLEIEQEDVLVDNEVIGRRR